MHVYTGSLDVLVIVIVTGICSPTLKRFAGGPRKPFVVAIVTLIALASAALLFAGAGGCAIATANAIKTHTPSTGKERGRLRRRCFDSAIQLLTVRASFPVLASTGFFSVTFVSSLVST